jgi:hypothetical protein
MPSFDTGDTRKCIAAAGEYTPRTDDCQQRTAIAHGHNHGVLAIPQPRS